MENVEKKLKKEMGDGTQAVDCADIPEIGDPEAILDLVLDDIKLLLNEKYPVLLKQNELFNISRLNFLLGGQFRIARMAREQGFLIQDCEMCVHYDKELSYCHHYCLIFKQKDDSYYYSGLCPVLKTQTE